MELRATVKMLWQGSPPRASATAQSASLRYVSHRFIPRLLWCATLSLTRDQPSQIQAFTKNSLSVMFPFYAMLTFFLDLIFSACHVRQLVVGTASHTPMPTGCIQATLTEGSNHLRGDKFNASGSFIACLSLDQGATWYEQSGTVKVAGMPPHLTMRVAKCVVTGSQAPGFHICTTFKG